MKIKKLLEKLKNGDYNENEQTSLPCVGKSPMGGSWPTEIWAWNEKTDEVIIGTCGDDFEIKSYAETREIYS